jgi:hypothetical protein
LITVNIALAKSELASTIDDRDIAAVVLMRAIEQLPVLAVAAET